MCNGEISWEDYGCCGCVGQNIIKIQNNYYVPENIYRDRDRLWPATNVVFDGNDLSLVWSK